MLDIQEKEKEKPLSGTEKRNAIIIVTKMRYELSAIKIESG